MLNSSDISVLKARQQSLLIGIDMSGDISMSSYQESVCLHKKLADQISEIISTNPDESILQFYGDV
jgi:hypothetical protein